MRSQINLPGTRCQRAGAVLFLATALCGAGHGASAKDKPKVHTVVIEAMRFAPEVIEVSVGDTVIWKNQDAFPHTVTADNRSFDSGEIATERSWKFKAVKKGVHPYICTLHPTMKGRLVVK